MSRVRIRTAPVGQCFGTVGIVELVAPGSGRKRRVWETETVPYGFDGAARTKCEDWAAANGFEVAS